MRGESMTREEAIHKLEYSKKAYQTLIDEKVDSGKLVGDGVRGEWKAETSLDEAYKSMIEALDMAIKALEQQPCEDCISREAVDEYITNLLSGYLYDEERTRLEDLTTYIWELPSVTPKAEQKWIPCTERLPKDGDTYLVTIEYKGEVIGVDVASYSPVEGYIDKHWDTFNDWVEDDKMHYHVTAWMPLPQPYKAESEDKDADSN